MCNANDVVRVLRKHGFACVGRRGSHQKWRHASGRQVIVAMHGSKPIPIGTEIPHAQVGTALDGRRQPHGEACGHVHKEHHQRQRTGPGRISVIWSRCPLDPAADNEPFLALRFQLSAFQHSASYPGVRIEFGCGQKLVAGRLDRAFHPQPVEKRALSLLLAGGDFHQAPHETGANSAPEPYYLR